MSLTPTYTNTNICPFVFDSSVDVTTDNEYPYTISFSGSGSTNAIYPVVSEWCVACCKDWCHCGWIMCWWCCNW